MRALVWFSLFLSLVAFGPASAAPRAKSVPLHQRTTLTAYVVPDLGVRFTFPFILDEQDSYVPFTLTITNPSFVLSREPGRNYFVITTKLGSPEKMLGNIFLNVAGFEISIELRTTHNADKNFSDIVFQLTKEAREDLIQQSIKQRTRALEQEYKDKFEALDRMVEQKAIARVGRLAIKTPDTDNIKEETKLKLPSGDSVVLYVEQVVRYEPYSIFLFNVGADSASKGLTILDAKLFSVDPDSKQVKPLVSANDIPNRVEPDREVQGAITVLDSSINPDNLLRLQVVTDKGAVEAEW